MLSTVLTSSSGLLIKMVVKLEEVALVSLPETEASVGATLAEAPLRVSCSSPMYVSDVEGRAERVI